MLGFKLWDILLDEDILYVLYCSYVIFYVYWFFVDDFCFLDFIYVGIYCFGFVIIGDLLFVVFECCCILKLNKNGYG